MDTFYIIILIYLAAANAVAFIICGIDKLRAIKDKWRIPEAVLLGISAIGGSIGMLCGMFVFGHKIRKAKFYLGVPAIAILQIMLAALLYCSGVI